MAPPDHEEPSPTVPELPPRWPTPPTPVRILFLSDTHLGLDLPARPRVERRRRGDDFFRCFEAALAPALAGEVDAVVHGGDLLYRSRVSAWLAEAALAPLRAVAGRGVPVLLVPGNHERGQVPYPLLGLHPNLHLFDRPRTVVLELKRLRVAFAGFPYAPQVRQRFGALLAATRHREAPADVRVLCLHQCVEGATCGPGDYTFRGGGDVIRRADLPDDVAVVLSGHIHRPQVLRAPGRPCVVYAGSVERTSFAEAAEPKGAVLLSLGPGGLGSLEFRPLPARPMRVVALSLEGLAAAPARARLVEALESTPADAVVQLRVEGELPSAAAPLLRAAALRALAGERTVTLAGLRGTFSRRSTATSSYRGAAGPDGDGSPAAPAALDPERASSSSRSARQTLKTPQEQNLAR
jgi:DNA repair exonuclease SbcCD nuclease subunit